MQSPYGTRDDIAKLLGMPIENVTVHVPLLGGGFGRKSKCDYAQEAALLSQAMGGAPVKMVWTREDDIQHGFYHTVSAERIEAGLDAANKVTAWRHRSVAPTIFSTFMPDPKHERPFELGMGLVDMPFAIPNVRCETGEAAAHVRIGWFRSVSNIPHAFAVQSFVAELAHAAGKDPKDFLLELLGPARQLDVDAMGLAEPLWNYGDPYETYPIDTGRLANVAKLAAEQAGWGRAAAEGARTRHRRPSQLPELHRHRGRGRGRRQGQLSIPRVDTAVDCGLRRSTRSASARRWKVRRSWAPASPCSARSRSRTGAPSRATSTPIEVARMDSAPLDVRTHIVPHGDRHARQRRRRAGRAAVRTGAVQRDLRRHRQAHTLPADRGAGSQADLRPRPGLGDLGCRTPPPARQPMGRLSHPPPPWRVGRRWRPRR